MITTEKQEYPVRKEKIEGKHSKVIWLGVSRASEKGTRYVQDHGRPHWGAG